MACERCSQLAKQLAQAEAKDKVARIETTKAWREKDKALQKLQQHAKDCKS